MNKNRRNFLQKSVKLTGIPLAGPLSIPYISGADKQIENYTRDLGIKLCLAYFWGIEPRKTALSRQMDVLGAVSPVNSGLANLPGEKDNSRTVIRAVKNAWTREGLTLSVIEGPPYLGEKTKLGLPGRDEEIDNFITLIKNLVSGFDMRAIKNKPPINEYGNLTPEMMWENLRYFLKAVCPEAEKHGVKLALHPDDPPIDNIQGIPRIMTSVQAFKKMLDIYPSVYNGITFCQGSFASMGDSTEQVNIPEAIQYFGKRNVIHFVHFRDVLGNKHNFEETFHDAGKTDMFAAMQAYRDIGFKGPMRPDHVPTMAGDSNDKPGYSTIGTLFAIGYIRGLMEGVGKGKY